jgi:hypothetical protein
MKMKGSSEIQEAAKLFDQLIAQSAVAAPPSPRREAGRHISSRPSALPVKKRRVPQREAVVELTDSQEMYRGDRLENSLYAMCKGGGFQGAVLIDASGLPLAVYNSPVDEPIAAAFCMILGEALGKAGKLLKQEDVNNISIDINYTDKAVIRRFFINNIPYFLMTTCPQDVDERAELELSIERIISILKKS